MYDYGSAEDNMKHYGVVSGGCVGRVVESVCLGGWWRVLGVCVGRVVVSAGCVFAGQWWFQTQVKFWSLLMETQL